MDKTPPADTSSKSGGNYTWRALWVSRAHEGVLFEIPGADQAKVATLIMNIGGTEILPTSCDPNAKPPAVDCLAPITVKGNQISIENLIKPVPTGARYTKFIDTDRPDSVLDEFSFQTRETPENADLSILIGRGGFIALAAKVLFGYAAVEEFIVETNGTMDGFSGTATGGLVNYINEGNFGDFPQAKKFLEMIPAPLLQQLVKVQRDPNAVAQIAMLNIDLFASDMAVQYATALADAANKAYAGHSRVYEPKTYAENVAAFKRDIAKYRRTASDETTIRKAMSEYTASVAASLGSGNLGIVRRK